MVVKMAEYIERNEAMDIPALPKAYREYQTANLDDAYDMGWNDALENLKNIPAADVVSKAAYNKVAWERHLAEVQLKSIGKSIGEKMDDVQPVKHGKWVYDENGIDWNIAGWRCSECDVVNAALPTFCGKEKLHLFVGSKFCPNCGARMDGGT